MAPHRFIIKINSAYKNGHNTQTILLVQEDKMWRLPEINQKVGFTCKKIDDDEYYHNPEMELELPSKMKGKTFAELNILGVNGELASNVLPALREFKLIK